MDAHYTPQLLAQRLIAAANDLRPPVVADLCAGRGDLLFQAETVWPHAIYAAIDIDPTLVRDLRRQRTKWHVGQCDLTNPTSRQQSAVLQKVNKRISLLLLNPPFSCRGSASIIAPTDFGTINASTAMCVLLTALSYLHTTGSAIAILPSGALHSQKDRIAWNYLRKHFDVHIIESNKRDAFPDSSANTLIIRFDARSTPPPLPPLLLGPHPPDRRIHVRIIRGCLPLHRSPNHHSGPAFVHSTDLRGFAVHLNGNHAIHPTRTISQPAVLIPRVGQLTRCKIALFDATTPIVLSDCVIALTAPSVPQAMDVQQRILDGFGLLHGQYVGTGAPFITLRRLRTALTDLGIGVHDD